MFRDPFDMYPRNNETIAEMHARHKKESSASNKVGMILVCLILLPWVATLTVKVLD